MWFKKKWILITVLAAVIILAVGAVGGIAYAQSSPTPATSTPAKTLAARVATILGIDQTKVEAAFTQAQKEMQDEALNARLKEMVTQGKLTQEQADKYKQWMQSRPNVPGGLGLEGGMGFPGGPRGMGGPRPNQPPATPTATPKSS
jgi:hypothetical protein